MNSKSFIWTGIIIGSIIGGYIPALWGTGILSFSGMFFSTLGAFLGLFVGYKLSR